ncbi:MAG: carboxylesterase family protein [Synergistaceae bacterium]|nr:carboxylesterase family protein [Synergistaceae bacterium]
MKKFLAVTMLLLLLCVPGSAAVPSEDIVILYTNDVHCGVDDFIGYAGLKYYADQLRQTHSYVTLVDAGDWAQGAVMGAISKGAYIVELMNAVGYDFAVPGNHEFDYTIPQFMNFTQSLDCGLYSSNFTDLTTNSLVLTPYKILTYGNVKVAFVGAATPETITKSTPSFFKNDNGAYIYSFGGNDDGSEMVSQIQKAVNDAKAEGADYIIIVGHLGDGIGLINENWSSSSVVSRLRGIDAFIDGHSHSVVPSNIVQAIDGKNVPITQSGTKLNYIGQVTISTSGEISTGLISSADVTGRDAQITSLIEDIKTRYAAQLSEVLTHSDFILRAMDDEGNWLVRNGETGLADLVTDSLLYAAAQTPTGGADIAIQNGGGIRTNIQPGEITYENAYSVLPFGNTLSIVEVSGQTILDELELGAMYAPNNNGGLLQVSGLTYVIDTTIPSTVVLDENGMFSEVTGDRRVRNVLVNGEPIDPAKSYKVVGVSYVLRDQGDGHKFDGAVMLEADFAVNSDAFADYLRTIDSVPESYAEAEGRMKILTDKTTAAAVNGMFEGYVSDDVITWLGVPYAKAPAGSLRWKAPQAPDASNESFDAKAFGPMPLQSVRDANPVSLMPLDEDCLYLNVYKASDDSTALRPVMVWVHGGTFRSNGTADPEWLVSNFAAAHPEVMFVAVGYRLGVMGFVDFSGVPGGDAFPESGNLGILDVLQAVKWIKQNIASFGGDPNNITLFGQSSGSALISLLMTMPESQGLFQRAILQSGTVSMSMPKSDAGQLAQYLLQATGQSDMAGLMALSSGDIENVLPQLEGALNFPVRDGVVLTSGDIYEAFARNSAGFDILIGTNADEVRYFMAAIGSVEAFGEYLGLAYQQIIDAVSQIPVYGETLLGAAETFMALAEEREGESVWAYAEFFNDLLFRGPAIATASAHQGNTYMYYWEIPSVVPGFGAHHGVELPYLMNIPNALNPAEALYSDAGQAVSGYVRRLWADFAVDGVINGLSSYTAENRSTLIISTDQEILSTETDPLSEQRELITPLLNLGVSGREVINAVYSGASVTPEPTDSEDITPTPTDSGDVTPTPPTPTTSGDVTPTPTTPTDSGDITPTPTPSESEDITPTPAPVSTLGSPSGGCDTGSFSMTVMLAVIPAIFRRRR